MIRGWRLARCAPHSVLQCSARRWAHLTELDGPVTNIAGDPGSCGDCSTRIGQGGCSVVREASCSSPRDWEFPLRGKAGQGTCRVIVFTARQGYVEAGARPRALFVRARPACTYNTEGIRRGFCSWAPRGRLLGHRSAPARGGPRCFGRAGGTPSAAMFRHSRHLSSVGAAPPPEPLVRGRVGRSMSVPGSQERPAAWQPVTAHLGAAWFPTGGRTAPTRWGSTGWGAVGAWGRGGQHHGQPKPCVWM